MPGKRMSVDEQRIQFVVRAVSGTEPLAALCREFGISRPPGYLWRARRASSEVEAAAPSGPRCASLSPRAGGRRYFGLGGYFSKHFLTMSSSLPSILLASLSFSMAMPRQTKERVLGSRRSMTRVPSA